MAAMHDGFGTFRPSTSFNDLSSLLTAAIAEAEKPTVAPTPETSKVVTKKRSASTDDAPLPKRNPTATRRVSVTKKESKAKVNGSNSETPNPLTGTVNTFTSTPTATVQPASVQSGTVAIVPEPAAVATAAAAAAQNSTSHSEDAEIQTVAQSTVSLLPQSAPMTTVTVHTESTTASTTAAYTEVDEFAGLDFTFEKVDTSTEHIKALTSNNWVAACCGASIGIPPVHPNNMDKNRARRQSLTADERARQNRDRNREHARNTRLRKKAYVEELKRTLTELVAQRDAVELEKRQSAQRELEQREVRFRVIEEFLKLRGRNESNFARWAAILEDGFSLTLPISDLNKMMRGEVAPGCEQTINGVSDVMADANVFASFLESMGSRNGTVACQFQCDRQQFFMDGCQAVLEWTATSVGAVAKVCSY